MIVRFQLANALACSAARVVTTLLMLAILSACDGGGSAGSAKPVPALATKALLGEQLFSDVSLSADRTQSCASCHNPDHAFIDNRTIAEVDSRLGDDQQQGNISPVSLGDDQQSLGDRNAPTAAYALFSPPFQQGTRQRQGSQRNPYAGFLGGQFHDGRAAGLALQAAGPPLNPLEMNMADKASVVARLQENDQYLAGFQYVFGSGIFNDTDAAYTAMTESIAEFEKTSVFAAFDSRYDRFLRGEYASFILTKAAAGMERFFSPDFTNCDTCHQLQARVPGQQERETFTSFEYHNIGVPENTRVTSVTGSGPDLGLYSNEAVIDELQVGKFKVPTLRNVAVTAPYMHNGVFNELTTVVKFYDHFVTGSRFTDNPETGMPWRAPAVAATVNHQELDIGQPLSEQQVIELVCFMRSLTDARYEHLIEAAEAAKPKSERICCGWEAAEFCE